MNHRRRIDRQAMERKLSEAKGMIGKDYTQMLHGLPRKDNYGCNVCAFCHYWEGDAQLHSHGSYQIELNERAKGRCLSIGVQKSANYSACSRFQMSNAASKYVKR